MTSDRDLLQAYLDGELAESEETAVEGRLRTEPALTDLLMELSREEAIFSEWAHSSRVGADEDTETRTVRTRLQLPSTSSRPPNRLRRWMLVSASVAAAIVVLVLTVGYMAGWWRHDAVAVARIKEVQGEVLILPASGEATPAREGQPLSVGQRLRTQGDGSFAVVTFDDNARLELGPDTTVRFTALASSGRGALNNRVYLEQGVVTADAARQPIDRPMILTTAHAEARLAGTVSSFTSAPEETRIESEQGPLPLEVTLKSGGPAVKMPPGSYAVASATDHFVPQRLPAQIIAPRLVLTSKQETGPILSVAYSADGALLAAGCWDGTIKLYDAITGEPHKTLRGHRRPVKALAFAPVGNLLASGNDERVLKLWDVDRGVELAALKGCNGAIESLAFSPDGALIATGGGYGKTTPEIRLWDVATRQEAGVIDGEHKHHITAVAFAPDGRTLASGGKDATLCLWDVDTQLLRQTLPGHKGRIMSLAFAPDGRMLASAAKGRVVKLWDLGTCREERTLQGHAGEVRSIAFTPDSKYLATADSNVTLWDVATGREATVFKGQRGAIGCVRFAPSGAALAIGCWDKAVRVWDVPR
jgi:WD40 repeat protein